MDVKGIKVCTEQLRYDEAEETTGEDRENREKDGG